MKERLGGPEEKQVKGQAFPGPHPHSEAQPSQPWAASASHSGVPLGRENLAVTLSRHRHRLWDE